jgi:hypothetical protein
MEFITAANMVSFESQAEQLTNMRPNTDDARQSICEYGLYWRKFSFSSIAAGQYW